MGNPGSDRGRTNLPQLTKKFLQLLKTSKDGQLDLTRTAVVLEVERRRVYDITNVLEGIGLLTKCGKNYVKWAGHDDGGYERRQALLSDKLQKLSRAENYLDKMIDLAKRNVRIITNDVLPLAYVTRDDLLHSFGRQSILAVKGITQKNAKRLPVLLDNEIILGRGLRISAKKPMEVLMATDEGEALVNTNRDSRAKEKRKSKLVPKPPILYNRHANRVPDHFDVECARDDKWIQRRFLEYKSSANVLLNLKNKNAVLERRLRMRNLFQAKAPFLKLSDNMSCEFPFALYDDEGVSDLYDIAIKRTDPQRLPANSEEDVEMFLKETSVNREEVNEEVEEEEFQMEEEFDADELVEEDQELIQEVSGELSEPTVAS